MSKHYPRIRIHTEHGHLLLREGLSINFYMRRSHVEVSRAVVRSLEAYLRAVGPGAIGRYVDSEGNHQELDDAGWEFIRNKLFNRTRALVRLRDALDCQYRYQFDYYGKPLEGAPWGDTPEAVCAVSFWLPTEYLEEHGPGHVRELALELAAPLPFCSGHAGLSFNGEAEPLSMSGDARKLCFRYPGLDIPNLEHLSWALGARVRGVHWLTFLGQPALGQLGGVAELCSRLSFPDSTVQELDSDRAVVTLGGWPESGDTEQGQMLPAYRALARVLEPCLYHEEQVLGPGLTAQERRRWQRRFLD